MKMISAVKLRKSQERLVAMRPYAHRLNEVIGQVVAHMGQDTKFAGNSLAQAFFEPREEENIHLVVIASDKGLCGGFNSNLLKAVEAFFKDEDDELLESYYVRTPLLSDPAVEDGRDFHIAMAAAKLSKPRLHHKHHGRHGHGMGGDKVAALDERYADRLGDGILDVIGRRTAEWAKKSGLKTTLESIALKQNDYMETACEIAKRATEGYTSGKIDALYVIYNYFNSAVSQCPRIARVFPPMEIPEAAGVGHLLEPDAETVLNEILPHYVEIEIYRTLLESSTSEHAARMAAMDKATSNANEMIDKLTLHMNKVRQAAITNQIIEVVSGAAS